MSFVRPRASYIKCAFLAGFISLVLSACEDPGNVGNAFSDIGSEVVVDTLEIGAVETDSVEAFSGMLSYFSAGQFSDPLFGNMVATGLIRPSLPSSSSSDSFDEGAEMRLRLIVNKDGVYGDSLATAEYDLIEVDQVWRGKSWKLNNEVQLSANDPVASFGIGQEDSLEVPLDPEWVSRYREFYQSDASDRDSLYTYEFHGLALVPRNEAKILPFDPSGSEFVIYNPEGDTVSIGATNWAYSLQRSNVPPAPAGTDKVSSTLEDLLTFELDLRRENLGTVNVSKVDLVFYQNNDVLNETIRQVSGSAVRPENITARLHLISPEDAASALDPGNPVTVGEYSEADQAFHFNITSFVNQVLIDGVQEGKRFYIRLQVNNGVVRSSLLYNQDAPVEKRPKLIVTSTKSEGS